MGWFIQRRKSKAFHRRVAGPKRHPCDHAAVLIGGRWRPGLSVELQVGGLRERSNDQCRAPEAPRPIGRHERQPEAFWPAPRRGLSPEQAVDLLGPQGAMDGHDESGVGALRPRPKRCFPPWKLASTNLRQVHSRQAQHRGC